MDLLQNSFYKNISKFDPVLEQIKAQESEGEADPEQKTKLKINSIVTKSYF